MHFLHITNFRLFDVIALLFVASALVAGTFFPTTSYALSAPPAFQLSASPVYGNAPLSVSFSATNNGVTGVSAYYVSFGDGTDGKMEQRVCSDAENCLHSMTINHTYTSPGTYTAKLLYSAPCFSGSCAAVLTEAAEVTVTVAGSNNADRYSVSPSSGEAPLSVTFTFDHNSACTAYTLAWGDGSVINRISSNDYECQQVVIPGVKETHTYTKVGTYTIRFQQGGMAEVTRTVTVKEADIDYRFSASPTSGDAPLTVDFKAYLGDEQSGYVDFGDGDSDDLRVSSGGERRTVSHTYEEPGRYTAKLTVESNNSSLTTTEDDVASIRITVRDEEEDEETDDRIEKLQQQIEELKEMLEKILQLRGSGEYGGNLSCPLFRSVLARGMSDRQTVGDITRLQQFLRRTGDYTYLEITGYFGAATELAVQRWQARYGVVSSGSSETTGYGVVGPKTQAAMARCGQ